MSEIDTDKKLKALKLARIVQPVAVPLFIYFVLNLADIAPPRIVAVFAMVMGLADWALLHWLVKRIEGKDRTIG